MSNSRTAILGGSAILPDGIVENACVMIHDGRIASVESMASAVVPADYHKLDATGKYVAPGYVDIHVHGGANADFMDGTSEAFEVACLAHLRHGTTSIFPTTTTGSAERIAAMIAAFQVFASSKALKPNLPGIHLYGPYFAEDKVGCHQAEGRRSPSPDEYMSYFDTGCIRIATCAAELEGAGAFYRAAAEHDCLITCGHSNATWTEMQHAFDAGMRHVDHFWCAMSSVPSLRARCNVPMQASMAEFVLMIEEMSTEVIADGSHLSAELLEFAYRMIGPDRLCLVTDCNRALDMPPGDYRFGNHQDGSWLRSDSQVGWAADGSSLASSVQGMDYMVRHMHQSTSAALHEVVKMATLTPAQRCGIDDEVGSLQPGKRADILILSQELDVETVLVQGETACN